jgi:hypothetical protein
MNIKRYNRILAIYMGLFLFAVIVGASYSDTYYPNSHLWEILFFAIGIPFMYIWLKFALKVKDTRNTLSKLTGIDYNIFYLDKVTHQDTKYNL